MVAAFGFIGWLVAAAVCGLVTLVLAIIAIRKRNMRPFWFALLFLAITAGCGVMAVYRVATGVHARVEAALKPRSGLEIYEALFGQPVGDCLRVTHQRDQIIPKLDTGISLRLKTCPAEMARILGQFEYTVERIASSDAHSTSSDDQDDFSPALLGDTVLSFYRGMDAGRNWRWIYCNRDSTEAIVLDALD